MPLTAVITLVLEVQEVVVMPPQIIQVRLCKLKAERLTLVAAVVLVAGTTQLLAAMVAQGL